MGPNLKAGPEGPVSLLIVKGCISAVPEAQIARELGETSLKPHQECHHLEITNDLAAELVVLQCTQKDFDVLVLFFHLY